MEHRNLTTFIKNILLIQIFFAILLAGVSTEFNKIACRPIWNVDNRALPLPSVNLSGNGATALFKNVNVVLSGDNPDLWFANSYYQKKVPQALMAFNIQALAGADLEIENPGVELNPKEVTLPAIRREDDNLKERYKEKNLAGLAGKQVIFYCTHTCESYIPDSKVARTEGKRGLITTVVRKTVTVLKDQGIDTRFNDRIHDYPEYNASYTNSRQTVQEILNRVGPDNIVAIFDVHRDSIPGSRAAETVKIHGKKSARILIIVGTDERKPHPRWKDNYQFAQMLLEHGEQLYPGLIKGVRTKAGTYNQEFHPRSLLIEIGNDNNTLEEASYAAELFTDVLISVLEEGIR
ncbi:stage II sporulation protein P [Syntrophomonas erecta]